MGRVGVWREKGLDTMVVENWVHHWWKSLGEVDVYGIEGQFKA